MGAAKLEEDFHQFIIEQNFYNVFYVLQKRKRS